MCLQEFSKASWLIRKSHEFLICPFNPTEDGELPDLDYLSTMTHIVLVDLDNWGSFFTQLPANLNQGTFIWGFQGKKMFEVN